MEKFETMPISMESEALVQLRTAIDNLLTKTIYRMKQTNHNKAKMAIALEIELDDAAIPDGRGGLREGVVPVIKHNVKTQIQLTDEIKGKVPGGYEMIWDNARSCFILSPIPRNQTSLFDDDDSTASGLLEDDDLAFDDADDTPLPFEDDETA